MSSFVFWQPGPSPHQAPLLNALADSGHEVVLVHAADHTPERGALPWNFDGSERFVRVPAENLAAGSIPQYAHHVVSGVGRLTPVSVKLRQLGRDPAGLHLYAEAYSRKGPMAPLQRIRYHRLGRPHHRTLDTVLAVGEPARRQYSHHFPASQVARFGYFPAAPNVDLEDSPEAPHVLYLGRLIRSKGVHVLLKALAGISGHDWQLTVVGEGPEAGPLMRLAEQEGVAERVRFAGPVAPSRIAEPLQSATVLAHPTLREGWGAVVNEALLAGVPVVTTHHAPSAELLQDTEDGVVSRADPLSLRHGLEDLFTMDRPSGARRDLALKSRRRFGPDAAATYLTQLVTGGTVTPPWHA